MINKIISFIKQIFSEDGNPSSKRVISILGTLSLIVFMFLYQSVPAIDAVSVIVLGALGVTGAVSIFKK